MGFSVKGVTVVGRSSMNVPVVIPTDPFWNNVVLLASLNNNTLNSKTNTTLTSGSITYSNTIFRFGTHSAIYDSGSDFIQGPALSIGTGDFTAEGWVYPTTLANSRVFFSNTATWATGAWWVGLASSGVASRLTFSNNTTGVESFSANGFVAANTWQHWAVSRNSGVVRCYINGVLGITVNNSTNMTTPSGSTSTIGNLNRSSQNLIGNMDEVRITVGVGRYPSAFTPPNAPFPTQ